MLNLAKNSLMVALTICLWNASDCFAQDRMEQLLTKQGHLLSEGSNTTPVGELKATTYRLETVTLTKPRVIGRDRQPLEYIFRLTILTSDPLPMKSFSIWMDGIDYFGSEQVGEKAVAMLISGRTLRNGLSLALAVRGKKDPADRSVLPETLYVPPPYATSQAEIEARNPIITLRRVARSRVGIIELKIENSALSFCHMNSYDYFIEIGGVYVPETCGVAWLTPEEFAQLTDGAEIVLKRGYTQRAQTIGIIGRLDKGTLQ